MDRLAEVWRRNQELRELVRRLREATGEVAADSEPGRRLAWAEDHILRSDPLRHLRARSGRTLTLYYYGYDKDSVAEKGFEQRAQAAWQKEKEPFGIELTARAPRLAAWERALKLELPEDLLLP